MSRVTFTPSPGESAGGEWAWSGEGLAGHTIDSCPYIHEPEQHGGRWK